MERIPTALGDCLKPPASSEFKNKTQGMPIFKQHPHYLGHLISEQSIHLPDKILTITNLAVPKNIDELCHFLGLTSDCRKFLPLFADVTRPLNKLLLKDTKFQLSPQCQAGFDHLKNVLCKQPILQYPSISKPYTLCKDASNYAFSGVLTQAVHDEDDLRPIAYTSGSFF